MIIVLLFSLILTTSADFSVNINTLLDVELNLVDDMLEKHDLSQINFGNVTVGDYKLVDSWLGDLSSLERTGDAFLTAGNKLMKATVEVGLKNLTFTTKKLITKDLILSDCIFVLEDNGMRMTYYLFYNGSECRTSWNFDDFSLGKATLYSDNPEKNGVDVTEDFLSAEDDLDNFFKSDYFKDIMDRSEPCSTFMPSLAKLFFALF